MSQNRIARRILKRVLVPALEAGGFQGTFPDFQRRDDGELHLLSVSFDKYAGGFFLELARHPPGDLETSWGEVFPEQELTVAHAPLENRARLQKSGHPSSLSEDWFRFDHLADHEIESLVREVVGLLPQVDDWLRERRVGKNISSTAP